jgi:hypothetical protein
MHLDPRVEPYRIIRGHAWASSPGDPSGAFLLPGPFNIDLRVLAGCGSDEIPWEHVSVSTPKRCPNWLEMSYVKDLFFDPEEAVMQLHPPQSQYVNHHPFCLHLWRPLQVTIPMPPLIAV